MSDLFAYGTLLVPEIWTLVTGTPFPRSDEALLSGFFIRKVKGATFPAITPTGKVTDKVNGRILYDLSPQILSRLDAYEDRFYQRIEVEVSTENEPVLNAETYSVDSETASEILSNENWSLSWFLENAFEEYWGAMKRS